MKKNNAENKYFPGMAGTKSCASLFTLSVLAIVTFISCLHFFISSSHIANETFGDMGIFVSAAQVFLHTGTLYSMAMPLEETYRPIASIFKFPPIYILDYLVWVDDMVQIPRRMFTAYFWLNIFRYGVTIFLVIRFLGPRHNPAWWAVAISMSLLFGPFYESLYGLAFDNLLLFALVAAFVLLQYRHKWPAAFLLGYICLAKIYPLPLMLYFVFKKQWNILVAIGIACVVWLMIALYFIGAESHVLYFTNIFPVLMHEEVVMIKKNMSIIPTLMDAGVSKELYYIILLSITALVSYRCNTQKQPSLDADVLYFCFIISFVLLLVPNCWGNYQMLLLFPMLALIGSALKISGSVSKSKITIALISWLPMLMTYNYSVIDLPYYSWFSERVIASMVGLRHYSAFVLWSGYAVVLSINTSVKKIDV